MKRYILWVTTRDLKGFSSHWHGWSKNLTFTYNEALKEKERLNDKFYNIEILEI